MKPPIEYRPKRRPLTGEGLRGDDNLLDRELVDRKLGTPNSVYPCPKFDRTAYQRDYMRKRRAAKRESTHG